MTDVARESAQAAEGELEAATLLQRWDIPAFRGNLGRSLIAQTLNCNSRSCLLT